MRIRIASLLTFALVLALAVVLAGCGSDDTKKDAQSPPFSFTTPSGWTTGDPVGSRSKTNGERVFAVTSTYEAPDDQVTIAQYKLPEVLPAGQRPTQQSIDRIVARLVAESRGHASEAEQVEFGGALGYEYVLDKKSEAGVKTSTRMTFLFKGNDQLQINCQSTADNRAAVNKGCDEILDTLQFD